MMASQPPFLPHGEEEEPHERSAGALPLLNPEETNELGTLRALLFQRELELLRSLQTRLDDPAIHARDISHVLAEAILLRAGKDDRLAKALQPTVENIFRSSVRKNPGELATTIFPLMGPAIRKSIAETFHNMLQGLNKALEMAFSWKGLRWRLEALRTGKSFAEIVLLHTLVYRVEQIFLIHAETGLLLGHVIGEGVEHQDADLVSGMLTAVQDFVKDCFAQQAGESLDTLQMGDRTLMVEKGPQMVLACVVRGTPPVSFRSMLRDTLELIHIEAAEALADFQGDTALFVPMLRHLDDCLIARYADENASIPFLIKCLPVAALLVLLFGFSFLWWQERTFTRAVDTLQQVPGIVVADVSGGYLTGWKIVVLRDPLSKDPEDIFHAAGIFPGAYALSVTPFTSLEPSMVSARLRKAMDAPDTATLRFEGGTLYLEGNASLGWILATTEKALAIPGVERVESEKISDPRTERLKQLIMAVAETRVEFPIGKDVPIPEDKEKLAQAVDRLAELSSLANQMGLSATLFIYGHADPTGTDKRNYELSEARATTLASMLYSRGVAMPIATYGFGAQHAAETTETDPKLIPQRSRRIELKVHLNFLGKSLMDF